MTDSKPTPGPWVIDEFYEEGGFYKIRGEGEGICHVHAFVPEGRDPQCDANARLIAAAPDLLKALSAAHGYMLNAAIDLETGAPKKTALATINGGIAIVKAALTRAQKDESHG